MLPFYFDTKTGWKCQIAGTTSAPLSERNVLHISGNEAPSIAPSQVFNLVGGSSVPYSCHAGSCTSGAAVTQMQRNAESRHVFTFSSAISPFDTMSGFLSVFLCKSGSDESKARLLTTNVIRGQSLGIRIRKCVVCWSAHPRGLLLDLRRLELYLICMFLWRKASAHWINAALI